MSDDNNFRWIYLIFFFRKEKREGKVSAYACLGWVFIVILRVRCLFVLWASLLWVVRHFLVLLDGGIFMKLESFKLSLFFEGIFFWSHQVFNFKGILGDVLKGFGFVVNLLWF